MRCVILHGHARYLVTSSMETDLDLRITSHARDYLAFLKLLHNVLEREVNAEFDFDPREHVMDPWAISTSDPSRLLRTTRPQRVDTALQWAVANDHLA